MLIHPCTLVTVIGAFAPLFSQRVFRPVNLLNVGPILALGKRTVPFVQRVRGKSADRRFQNYHRVLSRAPYPALRGGRMLLRLLVRVFVPTDLVVIRIDETIERSTERRLPPRGFIGSRYVPPGIRNQVALGAPGL
jgi:hypothetical protein